MAESIIFNVAGNIITKLGYLALREIGLIWGVNDELEKLKDTVSTIEAVLLDADEQQTKSNAVKIWLSKLKDAFYDVDDLIDECSYETLRRQVMAKDRVREVRIFFSKSNHVAFGLRMGHKIKEIREKLDAVVANSTQFHLSECMRGTRDDELRQRRYTHSFIREEEVIGRDNDRRELIGDLLNHTDFEEDITVIAIVGMGGLGKTTLAQSLYNDEKITRHFDLKLWVCISEEFDVKIIIEKIIESATNNPHESLEMDLLQSRLRREIDGKRYLLIMDDVWNNNYEKWTHLKSLLMGGAKGSKIVITTRSQQVARTSDTTILHSLEGLSEYNSWLLFKKMAYKGREEVENTNMIKIGKEIVAKLKGVPLAIRTLGRLLYFKNSEVDWLSLKDNELCTIMQQENEMQSILKLSYNHLPFNLKQCFSYCSLFPKDYKIEKDEVIKQWVAQGFVQPHGIDRPLEDVGNDYFMELLWRSFFQDVRKNEWGDVMECKMHDLMHDLARTIEENECLLANVDARLIDRRTRHISLHSYNPNKELELPESLFAPKTLRTFLLRYHPPTFSNTGYNKLLNKILSSFLRLRTLDLSVGRITKLPKSISKLRHLRYLDLSWNTHIEFLPNSVTELYNLETLILRSCWRLRVLPRDIKNWTSLRHLDLVGCDSLTCMPRGIGGKTSLMTMNLFVLAKNDGIRLSELNGLNNLRGSLTVRGLKFCSPVDLQENANYLQLKSGLQKLELDWDHYKDKCKTDVLVDDDDERVLESLQPHPNVREIVIRGYRGLRLSDWLSSTSFVHLITMRLSSCERLQHLPQLDQFPFLRHLDLQNLICIEYIDDNSFLSPPPFFPSLERLSISNMPNLKGWWKGETSIESTREPESSSLPTFPFLSQLEIIDCFQLTFIPRHPPLQSLEIGGVNMQLLDMVIKTTTNHLEMPFSCVEQHDIDEDGDGVQGKKLGRLCSLHLQGFSELEYVPEDLQHVTTLQHFSITDFPNLTSLPEWIGNLTSLSTLTIQYCPKLTSLPEEICCLTSLTELYIRNCGNLTSLFKGMHHFTSLLRLAIYSCSNLTSLPEGICHLHSLQRLEIYDCPELEDRCKKGTGEDWSKIAHVLDLCIP